MKWETLEPQRGTYNWAPADELVDFAKAQQPAGPRPRAGLAQPAAGLAHQRRPRPSRRAARHPAQAHHRPWSTHFKGKIWQWDVVNEAVNDDGTMRDTHLAAAPRPRLHRRRVPLGAPPTRRPCCSTTTTTSRASTRRAPPYYKLVAQLRKRSACRSTASASRATSTTQYGAPHVIADNLKRFDDARPGDRVHRGRRAHARCPPTPPRSRRRRRPTACCCRAAC